MLNLMSRHRIFLVYCLSLLWLVAACLWFAELTDKGLGYTIIVATIVVGTIVSYVVIWKMLSFVAPYLTSWSKSMQNERLPALSKSKSWVLLVLALLFMAIFFVHMAMLGHIPILAALSSSDDYDISVIRQEGYFALPVWLRYMSDYSFKALGPALLAITCLYRKKLFWFVLVVGSLYSIAMFVRILPAIFLAPLLLFLFFQRRWLHLVLTAALLSLLMAVATSASAPNVRDSFSSDNVRDSFSSDTGTQQDQSRNERAVSWKERSVTYAILERALFVPGQVINQWFDFYSRPEVREYGCGYRIFALLMKCEYVHIPTKLYQKFYPENVKRGMKGSLNAASFMNDYANFGPTGIVVSTILTALFFCMVTVIYRDHTLALPLNIPLIVVSMESGIITALNSGAGWLVMTALFLYFFRTK